MLDKILGVAAILALIGFMGVLVVFVPDLDLIIVTVVVTVMAAYDFYINLFKPKNGNNGG
jgi:hypothetical protein